jgi:hypothetical protein
MNTTIAYSVASPKSFFGHSVVEQRSADMTLEASIVIAASADRVWSILTDFNSYAAWNPFIIRASGAADQGRRISAFIRPPGQKGMAFRPKLLVTDPGRLLIWRGSVVIRGLLD